VLNLLDVAGSPRDLSLPGFRLHQLKGSLAPAWSIAVSRNWRITFAFAAGDVFDVDLVDYR
jgi:proteic killer suppression protein